MPAASKKICRGKVNELKIKSALKNGAIFNLYLCALLSSVIISLHAGYNRVVNLTGLKNLSGFAKAHLKNQSNYMTSTKSSIEEIIGNEKNRSLQAAGWKVFNKER